MMFLKATFHLTRAVALFTWTCRGVKGYLPESFAAPLGVGFCKRCVVCCQRVA